MASRIPRAELTGIYGTFIKWAARKMLGAVPDALYIMWHNRKVLSLSMGLSRKVKQWSECDESLKAYAHMAVACLVGCSFCLDAGYFHAHKQGLDLNKAREIPRWRVSKVFTPLERDVLEYAEAMTQTPPAVSDALSAKLLKALGPAAMVELTMFIGMSNMGARTNTALGIEAHGFSAACNLQPLALPST